MPRFWVTAEIYREEIFEVEADNEDEAEAEASARLYEALDNDEDYTIITIEQEGD